jgi:hypothetical protein
MKRLRFFLQSSYLDPFLFFRSAETVTLANPLSIYLSLSTTANIKQVKALLSHTRLQGRGAVKDLNHTTSKKPGFLLFHCLMVLKNKQELEVSRGA